MSKTPCCCHGSSQDTNNEHNGHHEHHHGGGFDFIFWISLVLVAGLYILGTAFKDQLSAASWLEPMSQTSVDMINSMWWGVLIGAFFVGIVSKVPREFIVSLLGKGGTFSGLLRATGAGVLLDLCSHGILMVGSKIYERGASTGQVIAFLIASPWNSFSLTLVLIGLIGFKLTVAFIVLSMIIALVTGALFDLLVAKKVLPENPNTPDLPADFQFFREAKIKLKNTSFDFTFFKEMIINGIVDSKMIVRWLLVGVLLAGILRTVFTPDMFSEFFGPTILGLIITLAAATIIEVCSEGSVPIASDIITRAGAAGNGFTFLMAGVATDYTEMLVLREATKSWKIPLFLPLLTVPQVLIIAWIMNSFSF